MYNRRFAVIILIIALTLSACIGSDNIGKKSGKFNNSQNADTQITKSDDTVQFHFIDVGQGDSILIQNGNTNILIDAGTSESGPVIYEYLRKLGIDYLDYFIGTHPHEDHLGGAASLLTGIDVGCIFLNMEGSTSYFYENFLTLMIERNIQPEFPDMDCVYKIGDLRLKFLSPTKDFEDENNNSLVLMVQFGDVKALFTGDAERDVESYLLSTGTDISADILKVGHHGSKYASTKEFLYAVYPSVAVIQSEEGNSYGHPHQEVLDRLADIDCSVLRCDQEGTIVLITDGKTIQRSNGENYELSSDKEKTPLAYIGNKKSKVFHLETCPNLPGEKNRIELASKEEAINLGYKSCGNCNP